MVSKVKLELPANIWFQALKLYEMGSCTASKSSVLQWTFDNFETLPDLQGKGPEAAKV